MDFKDRLRELRQKAALTQEQLASAAGMPVVTLRGLEQGQRLPSWPSVIRLARALRVATDDLIADDVLTFERKKPGTKKKQVRRPSRRKE